MHNHVLYDVKEKLSRFAGPSGAPWSFEAGGGERDRTDDLRRAKPTLSQLSYTPKVYSDNLITGLVI